MKRTTIYLPEDVHRSLRRVALEQEITLAEVIRRMSDLYLRRDRLFWETVESLQARNADAPPEQVEADVAAAVREVRLKTRREKRAAG